MGKVLMKGNEAIGEAAIRAGCLNYFAYPITPQSEVAEYLSRRLPEVGGVFLQGESEVAVETCNTVRVVTAYPVRSNEADCGGFQYVSPVPQNRPGALHFESSRLRPLTPREEKIGDVILDGVEGEAIRPLFAGQLDAPIRIRKRTRMHGIESHAKELCSFKKERSSLFVVESKGGGDGKGYG